MYMFAILAVLSASIVSAAPVKVEGVRLWRAPDNTRVVFDLSGQVEHSSFSLKNPDRLVIDLANAHFAADLNELALDDTPITKLRYAKKNNGSVRVVFDLSTTLETSTFFLKKHADKTDRLVVDLFDLINKKELVPVVATPAPALPKNPPVIQTPAKYTDFIIAIDAGHGGEDPGASGPKRTREKHIVLAISRELEKLFKQKAGFSTVMVRTGDYFIPLKKRRDTARKKRADLFISIHADAFTKPRAFGASVFALSRGGATSETARFLASKENEADLIGGVGGVSLEDKDELLAGVLVDLSMTSTLEDSLLVGDRVLKKIGAVTPLHKKQVEQAGFSVLKSPDVPSILVETGFISNPSEERKLNTVSHRRKLARAMYEGVIEHFKSHSPKRYAAVTSGNKSIAAQTNENHRSTYRVAKGDTLSGIARRFNISVEQLRKANGMTGSQLRIDQTLNIPSSADAG